MKIFNQYELYEFLFNYYSKIFPKKLLLSFISISQKKGFVSFFLPENEDEGEPQNEKWKSKELHIAFVHEMIHVYQQKYGKPSPNYHNKEYAQISEKAGLPTRSIRKPAGKSTGRKIVQTDTPDGNFFQAYYELPFDEIIFRPIPVIDEWSEYHGCVNTHMIERMRKRRVLPFIENTRNNKKQIRKQGQCPSCGKKLRDIRDDEAFCLVCLKTYDEDAYNRIIGRYKEFVFREIGNAEI